MCVQEEIPKWALPDPIDVDPAANRHVAAAIRSKAKAKALAKSKAKASAKSQAKASAKSQAKPKEVPQPKKKRKSQRKIRKNKRKIKGVRNQKFKVKACMAKPSRISKNLLVAPRLTLKKVGASPLNARKFCGRCHGQRSKNVNWTTFGWKTSIDHLE